MLFSFGFKDGISDPAVAGFNTQPLPGQETIAPGIILLGHDTDRKKDQRPSWARNGSFMAFRYLSQLVPEFDKFLKKNADPMSPEGGSEFLGARFVGRWKSGKSH